MLRNRPSRGRGSKATARCLGTLLHNTISFDVLIDLDQFCASMWTAEEGQEILSIAREVKPNIATYAIPTGLQVDGGPDAVVKHLCERVPGLLDGIQR